MPLQNNQVCHFLVRNTVILESLYPGLNSFYLKDLRYSSCMLLCSPRMLWHHHCKFCTSFASKPAPLHKWVHHITHIAQTCQLPCNSLHFYNWKHEEKINKWISKGFQRTSEIFLGESNFSFLSSFFFFFFKANSFVFSGTRAAHWSCGLWMRSRTHCSVCTQEGKSWSLSEAFLFSTCWET